ncbi:class I SAM-dependent methyltransferase [Streptomyces sp. AC555_RSS877]|uniref:class I SAM-dependent methyltransferase n=1 Tax=Streptomyces sp. AC555_RSS877 TaxID=2823688 RepID=UPI001C27D98A|nr:class I SAM-dependent methyltransferase [Streptomyces sp. AC555_RSS877]
MSASPAPSVRRLRSTARAMLRFPEPESWLDVGTGEALFPETARNVFPYTSFDGLDATSRVEWARWAERVEEAHVGQLTDPRITARLRARYDVVSLLHHLPHTPDPRAELRAALTVLRPGGHLLLELPDPHCAFARLLGRRWHAHPRPGAPPLTALDDLCAQLEAHGCTIVTTDRRAAHVPHDLSSALSQVLPRSLPPWVTTSLLAAARATDHALAPLLSRTRFSNTYRVIARSNELSPVVPAPVPPPPAEPARTRPRTPR